MQVVEKAVDAIYEVKKSTFLSYLVPMEEFESWHLKLKEEHPKAVHIVWAYRYFNEFNQIVENSSDDGEPKGTSGPPILNVLRGAELVNVAVLVVRYFGGIKLGTGGLVRAYGTSAKMVLEIATLKPYEIKEKICFTSKYNLVRNLEHFFKKEEILVQKREFRADDIFWEIEATKEQKDKFLEFCDGFIRVGDVKILA